jgi:hypothetical protein
MMNVDVEEEQPLLVQLPDSEEDLSIIESKDQPWHKRIKIATLVLAVLFTISMIYNFTVPVLIQTRGISKLSLNRI